MRFAAANAKRCAKRLDHSIVKPTLSCVSHQRGRFTRMLYAGRDPATIGSITGHADKTLILHYGHASTESRGKGMDVLENFAGTEPLGLGLDSVGRNALIYEGCRRSVVPEVGLEPT